jgi:hypothetical protein
MTAFAMVDRRNGDAMIRIRTFFAPVTVTAEDMKQPVNPHGLSRRKTLVARDAILRPALVGEVMVATRAGITTMIAMGEPCMVYR